MSQFECPSRRADRRVVSAPPSCSGPLASRVGKNWFRQVVEWYCNIERNLVFYPDKPTEVARNLQQVQNANRTEKKIWFGDRPFAGLFPRRHKISFRILGRRKYFDLQKSTFGAQKSSRPLFSPPSCPLSRFAGKLKQKMNRFKMLSLT